MIAACGGGSDSSAPAASAISSPETTTATAAPAPDITISNFTFTVGGPVKPGQQVTIVNDDDVSHSVAVDVGDGFDTRVSGGGGVSTFTAPSTPGTYAFHCKYHAAMHGTLVVE
ncbi:metal-binding protein [Mycobacterium hodleri]|uniref:Metal-binding protein n=2 Tax=Mycolicibacterium hodleri TaxID=49897 RepID=A0A502E846_9MYCO|nr:metal-binding protein [Mycolicibacterium hodleri]